MTSPPSQRPGDLLILIADDHAMVRAGLRRIVESEPGLWVCGQADDGASTLARLHDTPCDILLLDLTMPAPNGTELIGLIRASWPTLPVLVVTMHNNPKVAQAALQAGANGYITKDSEPETLLAAVRRVAAGGRYVESRLMEALVFAAPPPVQPLLTPRESQVLQRLAAGQGHAEIAQALYISEKTVSSHKINLMGKLKLHNLADLVRYADLHRGTIAAETDDRDACT